MQKMQDDAPDATLLSSEVMSRLKISRRTLERWVADGRLPAVKVGGFGARRYLESDVEALLRGEQPARGDAA